MNKLTTLLSSAKKLVKVGSVYHYSAPHKQYRVLKLAIREEDEKVSVIYESLQEDGLVWDMGYNQG